MINVLNVNKILKNLKKKKIEQKNLNWLERISLIGFSKLSLRCLVAKDFYVYKSFNDFSAYLGLSKKLILLIRLIKVKDFMILFPWIKDFMVKFPWITNQSMSLRLFYKIVKFIRYYYLNITCWNFWRTNFWFALHIPYSIWRIFYLRIKNVKNLLIWNINLKRLGKNKKNIKLLQRWNNILNTIKFCVKNNKVFRKNNSTINFALNFVWNRKTFKYKGVRRSCFISRFAKSYLPNNRVLPIKGKVRLYRMIKRGFPQVVFLQLWEYFCKWSIIKKLSKKHIENY